MARRTFTELQNTTKDYMSQSSGSFNTSTVANFIKERLNEGYHLALRVLQNYITQDLPQTTTSVAGQQRYHYPPSVYPPIASATMEVGSVDYPLTVVHGEMEWNEMNQIDFSGTSIPQYIFPMRDHFEIWPIPQADGDTITLNCNLLDRDMSIEDYTTGTVTVTNNDATITGAGTTWTAAMAGRWFKTTNDPTFYRIDTFTDTTHMELETVWEGITAATQAYTVGECPELPPELHELLPHFAASAFYAGPRGNFASAQAHLNYYWAGDYTTSRRDGVFRSGILGAVQRYSRRDRGHLISKTTEEQSRFDETWGITLSM